MTLPLVRAVEDNTLRSQAWPPARLRVADMLAYVGGQRFILYGVADAEQHLFVAAGPGGAVRALLWAQFEHFLEGNTHTYNYPAAETAARGGLTFVVDGGVHDWLADADQRPDSDSARVVAFLRESGFTLQPDSMYVRLVSVLGTERRRELMLIYAENLPDGLRVADLQPEGSHAALWPELYAALRERALASFDVDALPAA
jgi:hypothetical protein